MNPKDFPRQGDPDCTHTVGLYRSGRCRLCGFKVMPAWTKRFSKPWIRGVLLWLGTS